MRRRGFRRTARSVWDWSWLVTLPVVVVFVLWGWRTFDRWHDFQLRHRTSQTFDLRRVGAMELEHLGREARVTWLGGDRAETLADAGLETVYLFVPEGGMQRLDSALPHSGFDYVEGGMYYDGAVRPVDVRYRGDNVYHWGYWKKSWRVKTPRSDLYKGMRRFNLIAPRTPELLNNYLSYLMASHMGLVSPYTELVNVSVNGGNHGVAVLTEQIDESTIRRHELMPGDVYSGELVGLDGFHGARLYLFDHAGVWEKRAENNHFDLASKAPLERLLEVVRASDTAAAQAELADLVDLEAFGTFNAWETLVATIHTDAVHNWRLYYDPWRTRFVPIAWDPVGWHRHTHQPFADVCTSHLHAALFRNAEFLRARNRAFRRFFDQGIDRRVLADLDDARRKLPAALELDTNLVGDVELLRPREVLTAIDLLRFRVEATFAHERRIHVDANDEMVRLAELGPGRFRIEVTGRRPVERLQLRTLEPLGDAPRATLRYHAGGGQQEIDVSGALAVRGTTLELEAGLLAHHALRVVSMEPSEAWRNRPELGPATYDLELQGLPEGTRIVDAQADRGRDGLEPVQRVESIEPRRMSGLYEVVEERPALGPVVWRGDRLVDGTLEIDRDVIVRPGTTVRLGPGANVIFRGRVLAEGTAEAPILFVPAEEGQEPWGTVALVGRDSDGSRLVHCVMRHGSGWKEPLFEYSSMLSIHDVRDVLVADCVLEDNHVVDDMVHGVYSDVHFLRTTMRRALFDALDMDISEVIVEDCVFVEAGNDAVDLMTTEAVVVGTDFLDSGDKGISIGEKSKLLAIGDVLNGCNIGMQSKDDSIAAVVNCDFASCNQAVDAYKKNWRYDGGGRIFLYKCRMWGNGSVVTADRHSTVGVADTYVDVDWTNPRPAAIFVGDDVGSGSKERAANRELVRFPLEMSALGNVGSAWWSHVESTRRGTARLQVP